MGEEILLPSSISLKVCLPRSGQASVSRAHHILVIHAANATKVFAPDIFLKEPAVGDAVWRHYLPSALRTGQIKPVVKTLIAGQGLEDIQKGIEMMREGVSAAKIVVLGSP